MTYEKQLTYLIN